MDRAVSTQIETETAWELSSQFSVSDMLCSLNETVIFKLVVPLKYLRS